MIGERMIRLLGAALIVLTLAASALFLADTDEAAEFRVASPGYRYAFPYDHGAHDRFQTEWWYYTGHLRTDSGRRFGFELTFFRHAVPASRVQNQTSQWAIRHLYLAHFAVTDITGRQFRYAEKVSRAGLGKAGAEEGRLHIWIDRWSAGVDATGQRHELRAEADGFSIDVTLSPMKPPIIHGVDGVSRKGEAASQASHYYSLTRLDVIGTLTVDSRVHQVHGHAWMDHEFGSAALDDAFVGWDWFSIQLESGAELMFYRLRHADGTTAPVSSGTYISPEGRTRHLRRGDIDLMVSDTWQSAASGARYPSRWRLDVPSLVLSLQVTPHLANQELITTRSTQVTYWEGAVAISGTHHGQPIAGDGYVELTGYAAPFRPRAS